MTDALSTCIYIVRCNFDGDAATTQRWNEWYNGPKMADMLDKPGFLGAQRFLADGLDTRVQFLAVWHLTGPEALESEEYRNQWGFAEWKDRIVDWTRDLYTPADSNAVSLAVPEGGSLVVRAYHQTIASGHPLARDTIRLNSTGLDRSWPQLTVEVRDDDGANVPSARDRLSPHVLAWETLFAPLSPFVLSSTG